MPGFTTHYLFGLDTYKHFDNHLLKQTIRSNQTAFSLGLQGPDIFFYFLPSYTIHHNNIGAVAHTDKTGEFLKHLLNSRKLFRYDKERKIAEAYIAGFLGHYTLDTHCHPYIYWKTDFREKNGRYHSCHMSLETDIDTELLQFYKHCPPSAFRQDATIRLTPLQYSAIATVLHYVYQKTYPELNIQYITMRAAIRSMQLGTKWLHDPSGKKKAIGGKLETMALGYPLLTTLIPSDTLTVHIDPLNILHQPWENPWDKSRISTDSFFDLMEKAQVSYLQTLADLSRLFAIPFHTRTAQSHTGTLLKKLGNKSYHSGLDSTIPS